MRFFILLSPATGAFTKAATQSIVGACRKRLRKPTIDKAIRGTPEVFETIARAIRGHDSAPVVPGLLRPIDTNRIERDLDLRRKGAERGSNDLPASDESGLDSVEQTIVQKAVSEWVWHREHLLTELRAYAERLAGFSVHAKVAQLSLAGNNAKTRFLNANLQAGAELGPLKEKYIAARNELQQFKARHRLNRPARDSSRRFTTWGLLIFLIAIESLLNGIFFAKGSETGLIGGFVTAVGISAVNVLFAFLLGLWPARLINRRNYLLKLFGFIITLGGVGTLLGLHAFTAHFRDATAIVGEDRAIKVAIETLTNSPFALRDLNSVYLFGLGILCALFAFLKGLRVDDPYPGYGAMSRRAESARAAYSEEHLDLFGELDELKEKTVDELKRGLEEIPLYASEAERIRGARRSRLEESRAFEIGLEAAVNQLLSIYRDANREKRKTSVPRHFADRWKLERSFLDGVEVVDPEPVTQSEMLRIKDELQQLSQGVLQEYTNLIQHYPHPEEMS